MPLSLPHRSPESRRPGPWPTALLAGSALLVAALPAQAQSSPWYLGVAETITHEDNIYRLADGQATPDGITKADTISSTSLLGGLDQPIGRQRLFGSVALRANRYQDNDQLNNEGYSLDLGADLSTIGNVSGTVKVGADRSLARFNTDTELGLLTKKNVQDTQRASATVRVGMVTRLTAQAGLSYRRVNYSAEEYEGRENHQTTATAGLRYRPGASFTYGIGLRHTQGSYPRFQALTSGGFLADDYTRNGVDLSLGYNPGGASRIDAQVTLGKTSYEQATQRDFSGVTGSIAWNWIPGGRLRLNTRLSRDDGQNSYFNENIFFAGYTDYSRVTTALRVRADYELSAKVKLNATVTQAHRSLVRTLPDNIFVPTTAEGSDNTTDLRLGASWEPLRSVVVGCDVGHERRSASGDLSLPYRASTLSCYGQLYLR